jgi:hypothetical protein
VSVPEIDSGEYLAREIGFHLRHHFAPEALELWRGARVRFGRAVEILGDREAEILIPTDLDPAAGPPETWTVAFASTRLTLWNRAPQPEGFAAWPSTEKPLWYRDGTGRSLPAWDLHRNLVDLLSLGEEGRSRERDQHGRFLGRMSPRDRMGLLEVPAFNEAVAALVARIHALRRADEPLSLRLDGLVLPPGVVLSHDLDLFRGDDWITQGVRLYRFLRPLAGGARPALRSARAIVANARDPHHFYLDSIPAMVEAEQAVGARSSFYFLNGTGGRFGARNGDAEIARARGLVPAGWPLGIHYNYDTFLDPVRFAAQRRALERLLGAKVRGGRAHYLRIDAGASFGFFDTVGLDYDESLGYPDRVGYRAGVAGAYHPPRDGAARRVVEIPLVVMDGTLQSQYRGRVPSVFARLLDHIAGVGGSLSYLVHPGHFDNPENDLDPVGYRDLLAIAAERRARFLLPQDFLAP